MTRTKIWIACAVAAGMCFWVGRLSSQPQQGAPPSPAEMQAMMKRAMESAEPGDEHDLLETLEGEFEQTYTMWMQPGAPPMTSRGRSVNKMVLGRRFLEQRSEGMMGPQHVESLNYLGFDRRNEEFVSVGMDTMGTYFVTGAGKKNDAGLIQMNGVDTSFLGEQKYRFEMEIKSKDEYVFSVVFTQIGPQQFPEGHKMVEVRSKRVK